MAVIIKYTLSWIRKLKYEHPHKALKMVLLLYMGFVKMAPVVKNSPASAGDIRDSGSIPGSGRSPGVGNGNPL